MSNLVKIILAIVLGIFVLPIPCVFRRWTANYPSIKPWPSGVVGVGPYRPIVDEWKWNWLNAWYANSEDGVSGQQGYVWVTDAPSDAYLSGYQIDAHRMLVPYADTLPSWLPACAVAFAWSAWRNNANNLKRPLRNDALNKAWP